jgi:hypothetical protein
MSVAGLMQRRLRGFRVIDIAAMGLVLALALTVYAFKTSAGAQRADIADVESQIRDETRDVRLLRAKVATLERTDHIEHLARAYGDLAPVSARQEVTAADLSRIAMARSAAPAAPAAAATPDQTALAAADAQKPAKAPADPKGTAQ